MRHGKGFLSLLLVLVLALFLTGCGTSYQVQGIAPLEEDEMRVHFLDVGQGDSILIELPGNRTMLIDGGNRQDGQMVLDYIRAAGIAKLDYVVATHPHEDHIGGLIKVMERLPVGRVYMPKVSHTSKTFKQFVDMVVDKGHKFYRAKAGVPILEDEGLKVDILAPVGDSYDGLNNYSAVIKIEYGNIGMIFMGDAEKESEGEMDGSRIRAQVLKVGHHGSRTSTSSGFLSKVNPVYAVISAGEGNDFGHPHDEIIRLLTDSGAKILRTDLLGTITITTDGKQIRADWVK